MFCRYALPILVADLELLHEINDFADVPDFSVLCVPKGAGKRESVLRVL